MAIFYWLPFKCDEIWSSYFLLARGEAALSQMRHLPYMPVTGRWEADGEEYPLDSFYKAKWAEVEAGDTVKIVTHGRKFTTKEVAWLCPDVPGGLIKWSAAELAAVLQRLSSHVDGAIHWDLLACFGANMWGLSKSFASRLHTEMLALGMKGSLTAYQGATNIGASQGRQTGSGRVTAGFYIKTHKVITDAKGTLAADAAKKWMLL
jgi:hypothetical protein